MSKMKSTLAATLLTLVLAVPALAGNIGTPGVTPPPPPPSEGTGTAASLVTGNIGSPELVNILIAVFSLF